MIRTQSACRSKSSNSGLRTRVPWIWYLGWLPPISANQNQFHLSLYCYFQFDLDAGADFVCPAWSNNAFLHQRSTWQVMNQISANYASDNLQTRFCHACLMSTQTSSLTYLHHDQAEWQKLRLLTFSHFRTSGGHPKLNFLKTLFAWRKFKNIFTVPKPVWAHMTRVGYRKIDQQQYATRLPAMTLSIMQEVMQKVALV